jgi:YHS domain-containing protein
MKKELYIGVFFTLLTLLTGCISSEKAEREESIDLVCHVPVNKATSFKFRHAGTDYFFDSYDCREAFKRNPKNFLDKTCFSNDSIIDPVCGIKVDLSESYDLSFSGKVYHFHSNDCRQAFKRNPSGVLRNLCASADTDK